jgi:hypothetical protein
VSVVAVAVERFQIPLAIQEVLVVAVDAGPRQTLALALLDRVLTAEAAKMVCLHPSGTGAVVEVLEDRGLRLLVFLLEAMVVPAVK